MLCLGKGKAREENKEYHQSSDPVWFLLLGWSRARFVRQRKVKEKEEAGEREEGGLFPPLIVKRYSPGTHPLHKLRFSVLFVHVRTASPSPGSELGGNWTHISRQSTNLAYNSAAPPSQDSLLQSHLSCSNPQNVWDKTSLGLVLYTSSSIYQRSWEPKEVSTDWKLANVITRIRMGSGKTQKSRQLHLILPGKIMKKIYWDPIKRHVKDNEIIRHHQHGITKGKSCLTNLISFYAKVCWF